MVMSTTSLAIIKPCLILALVIVTEMRLEQVVSLFRHGARYYSNDLYDANMTDRTLWRELTAVGMRQHQNLGKMLRSDYIDHLAFLSPDFKEGEIQVFSTDVKRTIQSAICQLYGLYPLGTGQKLINVLKDYHIPPFSNNSDSSQPTFSLPFGYLPLNVTVNKTLMLQDCSRQAQMLQYNENLQLDFYKEMNLTYFPFLKRIAAVFNIPLSAMNFSKITNLYDTLTVDDYLGRPFPKDNFTREDYENIVHLNYWYTNLLISHNFSRVMNAEKFRRVIRDFDGRIQDPAQGLKWTFLSGHDSDLTAMLSDLNISSALCIEQTYRRGTYTSLNCHPGEQFAASLIIQLHSIDKQYWVKVRHDGEYVYLCERKDYSCLYSEFKERITRYLVNPSSFCNR